MLLRKKDCRMHGETTFVELGPQDLRVAGMGEKHDQHEDGETGREMPTLAVGSLADQLDTPLELPQSFLECARPHFAVEPFTHCPTHARDSDYGKDGYISCREQGQVRPAQQQERVSQSPRLEVPHGDRDRQDQQSFEVGGCERVKVNRLEFADPCKVKGRSADIARYEYGDDSHRD
jgi:hypothetical protein